MPESNEQLSMFEGREVKHIAYSMSAKKLDPHKQPTHEYHPGDIVYFVGRGYVPDKTVFDRAALSNSRSVWTRFVDIDVECFYDVDEDVAVPMIEDAEEAVRHVVAERLSVPLEVVGGDEKPGDDVSVMISHTDAEGKRRDVKTTQGVIRRTAERLGADAR